MITDADFTVWNDTVCPVGILQATGYMDKKSIHFFNRNRYIVVVPNTCCKSLQDILKLTVQIKSVFQLPLFVIQTPNTTNNIPKLAQQVHLYAGIISVDNTRKTQSVYNMITSIWRGSRPRIQHHVPVMIVNSDINPVCSNGKLAKYLYNAYSVYDADKLTVMLYPGDNYNSLWADESDFFKQDVLNFLADVQN